MLKGRDLVCQHWCGVGHDTEFWNKALTFLSPSLFQISSAFNIFNLTVNGYVTRHLQRQCTINGKWLKKNHQELHDTSMQQKHAKLRDLSGEDTEFITTAHLNNLRCSPVYGPFLPGRATGQTLSCCSVLYSADGPNPQRCQARCTALYTMWLFLCSGLDTTDLSFTSEFLLSVWNFTSK